MHDVFEHIVRTEISRRVLSFLSGTVLTIH